jgi:LPXTG-site transpeptidase (sortase) family protein
MATKSKKQNKSKQNLPLSPIFQPVINWKKVFGRLLISTGVFLILITIFLTQMAYISPDKQTIVLHKEISESNYPTTIQINTHTFTIEKGTFKYGLWPLSDSNPTYLETSGTPGQSGNIIIYGHNTPSIFHDLHKVKEGSVVTLTTNSDQTLSYKIDNIKQVFPQDVEILRQGSEERITLFTCTGLFDSMRLVVSGKRI